MNQLILGDNLEIMRKMESANTGTFPFLINKLNSGGLMKKLLLPCLFFLFVFTLKAEIFWEKTSFPDTLGVTLISISPAGYIYAGTSAYYTNTFGILISKDNGLTWQKSIIDTSMTVNSFYYKDSLVYICSSKGLYKSLDSGYTGYLYAFDKSHVYSIIINELNHILVGYEPYIRPSEYGTGLVCITTNNGYSWKEQTIPDRFHKLYLVEFEKGKILLIGNRDPVHYGEYGLEIDKTTDFGYSWESKGLWNNFDLWDKGYYFTNFSISPVGNILINLIVSKTFFVWNDNKNKLDTLNLNGSVGWGGITASVFSKLGHIYLGLQSFQDGVYRSTDEGLTWTELYEGLDHRSVNTLAIDSNGILYAGTDKGIYRSKKSILGLPETEIFLNKELSIIPNPVNGIARIKYSLNKPTSVTLSIESILGVKVIQLENNLYKNAGNYNIEFDSRDLPSGIYFCTINYGVNKISKSFVIIK